MMSSMFRPLKRVSKRFGGCRNFSVALFSFTVIILTLRTFWSDKDVDFHVDTKYVTQSESDNNIWKFSSKALNDNSSSFCDLPCGDGEFSYSITSGHMQEGSTDNLIGPTICFQGKTIVSPELQNGQRGINMVVADSKTGNIKHVVNFDTYITQSGLVKFLKTKVNSSDIIMLTTLDDAFTSLKTMGRRYLGLYGSKAIKSLGFRENFVMVGHMGLEAGFALEAHSPKLKKEAFGRLVEQKGCFKFPLGKTKPVENESIPVLRGANIKVGERHDNCGLPAPCAADYVSVAVDTGYGNSNGPQICVDGFVRLDRTTNGAGRGFNLVALDPNTLTVNAVTRVDTYESDNTDLEIFLDDLKNDTIIIAVISDEASTKLEQVSRDLLNGAGSGMIQNLRFRDVWYFVGQKGLKGFTRFEELSYAPFGGGWPKRLTNKFCIPKKLSVIMTIPDPAVSRNDKRRAFCTKYEGYTDFCNPEYVDEPLQVVPVYAKELKDHKIFETPILVIPGINHNAFVNTLQTALMQPGIKPQLVSIFWDESLPEYKELANLFGFREFVLDSSVSYSEQMNKAMKSANIVFPQASHMIVVEEDLLLGPDFLPYMAHCMDVMAKDSSLVGASAWNFNGFINVSGKADTVYRVQDFPGLGFLLKAHAFNKLVDSWGACCQKRAWLGWKMEVTGGEMLVPDVSRVYRTPLFGALASSNLARDLFLKPRKTHLDAQPTPVNIKNLETKEYEAFLKLQVKNAFVLPPSLLEQCVDGKSGPPKLPSGARGSVAVFYHQDNSSHFKLLKQICRCFGLVSLDQDKPKNLHNGMLRFFYENNDVFLIGTASPYYDTEKHNQVLMDPDLFKS